MTSELMKEIKENKKTYLACFVGIGFLSCMMIGLWIDTDPSQCHEKIADNQTVCIQMGWGFHFGEILLPTMIIVLVWRIFRDDGSEDISSKETNENVGFDYSKLGANSKQPINREVKE